ncbi:putative RNA polymerase beta subunit [Ralstonia phage RP31]|uniref:Putative RNA polymerase beta subunit n=2 Tax=Ripduovirus RP12 TaxID=2560700 RepID=A0A1L7N0S5_9CAUD|nr:polymerase [Ralstonia phage RP12]BAW19066.1 putative RNA polymerase beta subunit [Ralstonia phage RP12]BAW19351.1 putative RNA polymerase beta subunit [Ralstonia phage RP31]
MHPDLVKFIEDRSPKINMDLAGGLARVHMKHVCAYVDEVLRSAAHGFPDGLTYDTYRICDPFEEYRASLKPRNKKRKVKTPPGQKNTGSKTYDTSRTDFFLMELSFSFQGKPLQKRPIYLPFVGQGGSIYISGTKWFISPVLADRVISVGTEQIFVRLLRDRLTFSRLGAWFKKNGQVTRTDLVHSRIYHQRKDKDKQATNNAFTSMPHYLFCKYGFAGTLEKYLGITPMVGNHLDQELDPNEWDIYTTQGIPPKGMTRRKKYIDWRAPEIQVAIKKSDDSPAVLPYIAALFYVADYFPRQITPNLVNSPDGWIAPMGYMLFSENNNRGKIEEAVRKHLSSLDDYADSMVIDNMAEIGLQINDIYDFFAIIADKFSLWVSNNQDKVNSMYNKELSVLYFVLFDVTKAIFNLFFALKANSRKELTERDIEKHMKENLKPGMCYQLGKSHGEVASISYSGDNMAFKATSTLTPQTATSKMVKKAGDRGTANDPSRRLHPSIAEVAAISCMPKSDPDGRSKINHYMLLDDTRTGIMRNPKFENLLDMIAQFELTTRAVLQQ